jgi:pyrimidine-nucleoside phosphorylase
MRPDPISPDMIPAELLARKRDGGELTPSEISAFMQAYTTGEIPDYQMAALAMAICVRGMTPVETMALTRSMLDSGERLQWPDGMAPRGDKHSTGGLGDKTSLVLAPLLACLGFVVPMISGRGLGITGGTLDKLEAIPGFSTQRTLAELRRQVEQIGCAIVGATPELAPADRKLYALRDVTGTVPSIPLITASILSKKLAESLDHLVMDVKFGSAAFMKTAGQARELADSLVHVAELLGVRTTAVLSDMHQPLGRMVGNAVEVHEALAVLEGSGPTDVRQLVDALAAELLLSAGVAAGVGEARRRVDEAIGSGRARDRFETMVVAQGGRLPAPPPAQAWEIHAEIAGQLVAIHGELLGQAVIEMGGGRRWVHDTIDPTVGLEMLVRLGDHVERGQPLVRLFMPSARRDAVVPRVKSAFRIAESINAGVGPPLVLEVRGVEGMVTHPQ